jgi:glycosyltransferase involved in cell wall biosynthesis
MNAAGGGAALSTLGLIAQLEAHGVRSSVVCDLHGTEDERNAIRVATRGEALFTPLYWWNPKTRVKTWKRPALEVLQLARTGFRLGELANIVRAARQWAAELIHTNTMLTPEGGVAARVLGLGHVWHLREMLGPNQPHQLPLGGRALGEFLKANSSVVVANSEASAAALKDLLPAGRLKVIHNGIALEAFETIQRRKSQKVVMGMVANLTSRWKKHMLFADAAKRAPGAEYRLYGHAPAPGTDPYADEVRQRCTDAGVKVMGFVEATQVMSDLDVLVHTADGESFGRTVVEAMAAGLPVVGVAGGGVGETVINGETGLLARPDAAAELAAHLTTMIADEPLRRRMGEAGRKRASGQFSLRACGDRVAQTYREALAAPLASGSTVFSLLGLLP